MPQEAGAGGHITTDAIRKVPLGGILPISVTTVTAGGNYSRGNSYLQLLCSVTNSLRHYNSPKHNVVIYSNGLQMLKHNY